MLAFSGTTGAIPFLARSVVDDIFVRKDETALAILPFVIVAVFTVRGLMNFGQSYLTDYVGLRIIKDLRNLLNQHLQSLSVSFFQSHPTGTLISRVNNDVMLVRSTITDSVASLMRDVTSVLALTAVAFYEDWFLASMAVVVFPASVLPISRLGKRVRRFTKQGQVAIGNLASFLQETIQGNRIVKAFGMKAYESRRFAAENERLFKRFLRASRMKALVAPALELLASVAIGAVMWYGGSRVIDGHRTPGEFMAFLSAMFLMYQPFRHITRTYATIQQGMAGAERIFEVLDVEPAIRDRPGARVVTGFSREIEFANVSFGYSRRLVLKNINLKIKEGEMVALVGVSGVGKSTLSALIPRFFDVTSGKITIDGVDIREVKLESLRSQIGIVDQHTFLFNDTVKNNIAYGDLSKEMSYITAAAKAAHAHDFIMKLPQGYDTIIGELGLSLSGGQRQRLAIARALIKNAPILILDEATSSLDSESENLVQRALEHLMNRRTTLVIAHRLSTIRKASRIIVLVGGSIVEEGTHEDLLARKTEYSRLYTLQLLGGERPLPGKVLH